MSPPVLDRPADLRARVRAWRAAGESVALVPTMGDLHEGHLTLVDAARERAQHVVASVFVNPLQFGPGEDYQDYPRRLEDDAARLGERGADLVFAPTVESLYPHGTEAAVRVHVPAFEDILCGAARPGHFTGVATVVAKLFNIAEPDIAVFGQKDYQQLLLIRRLVSDLDFPIDVVGMPTVRESDGVAMSSRNGYLDADQRRAAPALYAALRAVAGRLGRGERDFGRLERDACVELEGAGMQPEYVAIRMAEDLARPPADAALTDLRILAAARLGRARLIDNIAASAEAV
ncbi:pantoate--beta-alanine ligase [Halofilum ochraceum]|uniref:pantoate--beta-alanine ligase n=1 Tax=Halofilum ochraceum TaxID=1611323 RepID=UPI00082B6658|nr:pantoate--beta-alanine ligase [Halofilum ochraceum]